MLELGRSSNLLFVELYLFCVIEQRLEIKQAADGTLDVPGLVEPHVNGFEEMWEFLKSGSRSRSVGSTSANELSSRSHWYFSCYLKIWLFVCKCIEMGHENIMQNGIFHTMNVISMW